MERECEVDDPLLSHSWTLGLAVVDTPGTHLIPCLRAQNPGQIDLWAHGTPGKNTHQTCPT